MVTRSHIGFDSAVLRDDFAAFQREWLITNGLGGYASATLAGANTRRYHGLLVAALAPPVGRAVLLSKLEETLEILDANGSRSPTFALSANLYPGVIYPQGHHLLESWEAYPAPTWVWSPQPGVRFEKRVWMAAEHNATYIAYRLLEAPEGHTAHLHLIPLLAWKDYHSEMRAASPAAEADWFPSAGPVSRDEDDPQGTLRVQFPGIPNVTHSPPPLDLRIVREDGAPHPDAVFAGQPYWYYQFEHPREQERGLEFQEDLYALGMFSIPLKIGESVVVIAEVVTPPQNKASGKPSGKLAPPPPAIAPLPPPDAAWAALEALAESALASVDAEEPFVQQLTLAASAFLVQAPYVRSTIIAGYHWFCDWGRDTMIALPGLCLTTGRTELAREILLAFAAYVDQGMLPNRFPDVGATPEYNTVDATLWYFVAIYRYCEATGDLDLLRDSLWDVLQQIIRHHQEGTRYQIYVDTDSLLHAGQPGVQLTWMDAKVGDWVVTPRIGKPVEVNALWHNALRTMAHFAHLLGNVEAEARYQELAETNGRMFLARFPRHDGRGLYDVLATPDHNAPDETIRPNQVFALSLPFAPLEPASELARSILGVIDSELRTPFGLRTLSPHDPDYRPTYGGDQRSRDSAYHQGTVWPWLLGAYAEAHYRVYQDRAAAQQILQPLQTQLTTYGIGALAEIFDGGELRPDAPAQRPQGCIAQAWSVAEILRVWKLLH